MFAIVEYHEYWCPNGQICSVWATKERAVEIFDLHDLANKTSTPNGSCYFKIMSKDEVVSKFKDVLSVEEFNYEMSKFDKR